MSTYHKPFLRAASVICQELTGAAGARRALSLPAAQWRNLVELAHSIKLARSRGWLHATRRRQEQLLAEMSYLQQSFTWLMDQLREAIPEKIVPAAGDVYRDLVSLEEQFTDVQCDLEDHVVAVTTEPVVLDGIDLGRFQIRLDWQELEQSQPYKVVALDPHPAESNASVTHPHVSEEILCEGDGRQALRAALAGGRLLDFFTIVDRLLCTYAPGRAYVELDHWDGLACRDCGSIVSAEDRWCCDRCEEVICADCSSSCPHCDRTCCSGCSSSCPLCDESSCASCLERCVICRCMVCPDCLSIDPNQCVQCHEELHEERHQDRRQSADEEPEPAVHPAGLGETTVSA